jgi:glucose/arabinose dehydrogenase
VLAAVLSAAALLVPASAAAKREWPRRLFVLVPSADLGNRPLVNGYAFDRYIQDVAEAPDGSILLATDRGWPPREGEVLRLTPGGRLRTLGR